MSKARKPDPEPDLFSEPPAAAPKRPDRVTEPEAEANVHAAAAPRLLIVDDEEAITKSLGRYFRLEGYDVLTSNSPYEALRLVHRENVMVVISDIAMPGMTGVELLRRVKEHNGMVQVIMVTGYVTLDNILTCLRLGADDCFIKPLTDLEQVRTAVDQALEKLRKWHRLMVEISSGRK
jgi:DNA-binding NtrC family response regulator